MSTNAKEFIGMLPTTEKRPLSAFFGKAGTKTFIRDNFSITTWLCLGAIVQGVLFLAAGRLALIPAFAIVLYRSLDAYAQAVGWKRNTYMDGIIQKKFSTVFPDEEGKFGSKPANSDIVVFLIGTRINHPLGLLAPGTKELLPIMPRMVKDLEAHADEFGFLGATSWLNSSVRETNSETMMVCYFRTVEGLHKFAHSPYHREAWGWWNKTVMKKYNHFSIYHETYQVPHSHWESIYINSHVAGINTTVFKVPDQEGKEVFTHPVVDASKGLLKTSAGRMARSKGDEHDKYGADPYDY